MFETLKTQTEGKSFPFMGVAENGERVIVYHGVCENEEFFKIQAFQENDWIRTTIYYADGSSETLYEK